MEEKTKMKNDKQGENNVRLLIIGTIFLFIGAAAWVLFIGPKLAPWYAMQEGKSELAKAEQNRQIATLEAKAKKESAELLAEAEISRAKGVSESNKIIGASLKENEEYLRYLWIDAINSEENQIIYVPTEAGLPILEANRLQVKK